MLNETKDRVFHQYNKGFFMLFFIWWWWLGLGAGGGGGVSDSKGQKPLKQTLLRESNRAWTHSFIFNKDAFRTGSIEEHSQCRNSIFFT
jgi:hypothetical protein